MRAIGADATKADAIPFVHAHFAPEQMWNALLVTTRTTLDLQRGSEHKNHCAMSIQTRSHLRSASHLPSLHLRQVTTAANPVYCPLANCIRMLKVEGLV
jgi:hypothetical protein